MATESSKVAKWQSQSQVQRQVTLTQKPDQVTPHRDFASGKYREVQGKVDAKVRYLDRAVAVTKVLCMPCLVVARSFRIPGPSMRCYNYHVLANGALL